MIKKRTNVYVILIMVIFGSSSINSQTCGFGCLGLSGIYAGYSIEEYEADGLNSHLNGMLEDVGILSNQQYNFERGMGFRFGMNIVRANFDSYFFTVKGYYQYLKEEQAVDNSYSSAANSEFKSRFEMNHWALGFDFGIPVVDFLDWKIIDGSIKFFDTKLTNQVIEGGNVIEEVKYEIPKVTVGYAVGSGLIIHIVRDYVSIEGMGMYNFTQISSLTQTNSDEKLPSDSSNGDLISKGGLSATIQLNIGIPL